MSISAAVVTVATSATLIQGGADADPTAGSSVLIKNTGAATVFLGGSGVTTATGYPLAVGGEVSVALQAEESVYGIVASGTNTVNVLRQGV